MLKPLIAPIVTAAVVAGLAVAGGALETYNVNDAFRCSHALTEAKLPPADILFVGNSQTGAAIDPAYVAALLKPMGSPSVEKLATVEGHIIAVRMLVEDYVQKRGRPKLVVLQPMVVRATDWQQAPGRPIHPRADLVFQPWDELVEVQESARFGAQPSGLPVWADAGYRTLPAVFIDRIVEQITAALSFPRLMGRKAYCQGEGMFRQADIWPYQSLPLPKSAPAAPSPTPEQKAEWSAEVSRRSPLALDDPSRLFELDQNRRLLDFLNRSGVQVMLIAYPNYSSADQDLKDSQEFAKALGQPVINVRSLLSPSEKADFDNRFRDHFHVAYPGAEIISRHVAEAIGKHAK